MSSTAPRALPPRRIRSPFVVLLVGLVLASLALLEWMPGAAAASNAIVSGTGAQGDPALKEEGAVSFTASLSACSPARRGSGGVYAILDEGASTGPERRAQALAGANGASLDPSIWAVAPKDAATGGFSVRVEIPNGTNNAPSAAWTAGPVHTIDVHYEDARADAQCARTFYVGLLPLTAPQSGDTTQSGEQVQSGEQSQSGAEPGRGTIAPVASGEPDDPAEVPQSTGAARPVAELPADAGEQTPGSAPAESADDSSASAPDSASPSPEAAEDRSSASSRAGARSDSSASTGASGSSELPTPAPETLSAPARELLAPQTLAKSASNGILDAHSTTAARVRAGEALAALGGTVVAAGGVLVLLGASVLIHLLGSPRP
ncbi:hypothetical protein [Actinomyces culturomici]|uniref:hypothetical protein n=1 Tax=Actinomyces culturomici TaxID=1926276 RepID=UPI000E2035C4|nr:hypothetical protein [Actinomyces culturomici]